MTGTAVVDREAETPLATTSETLPIIAHKGGLELIDAEWKLNSGRIVKFRLVNDNGPILIHPFMQFVRRRGNRVGTRFMVAMTRVGDDEVFFQGEVMLAGGGNPLGQGMWVRFWLDEDADTHPFSGCAGRHGNDPGDLFEAVFVELDDDDFPINQEKRERIERSVTQTHPLTKWTATRDSDKLFHQWLSETAKFPDGEYRSPEWWRTPGKDFVARWIRWMCNIGSRADFKHDQRACEVCHDRIRRPYSEWRSTAED